MFRQDELVWSGMFPFLCVIICWFSIGFALLRRVMKGRYRRQNVLHTIEWLVKITPTNPSNPPSIEKTESMKIKYPSSEQDNSHISSRHDGFEPTRTSADVSQQQRETNPSHAKISTKIKNVTIPTPLRVATRAVIRRAVVVVGGEFARSPRMQYHATSLAQSGLFDEILLLGLDSGNQLSEALRMCEQAAPSVFPATDDPDEISHAVRRQLRPYPSTSGVDNDAECTPKGLGSNGEGSKTRHLKQGGGFKPRKWGCFVSSDYLIAPPQPPDFFQLIFPLRSLHWMACTLYRILVFSLKYFSSLVRSTAIQVNAHGQLVVTSVIFVQTPPAIPFVPLIKYMARPVVMVYNLLLYYCFIVPVSWSNPSALREIRTHGRLSAGLRAFWPALVVDWHNYGYTILESAHRPRVACAVYKWLELHICAGDVNVTVSRAMKQSLLKQVFRIPEENNSKKEITNKDKRIVINPTFKRSIESTHGSDGYHRPLLSSTEGKVLVLYDVAPSFFAPSNRRTFVEEVLLTKVVRRNTTDAPIRTSSTRCTTPCMPDVSSLPQDPSHVSCDRDRDSAPHEGVDPVVRVLDKDLWGIEPPPAWVLNRTFLQDGGDSAPLHRNASDDIGYHCRSPGPMSLPHHSQETSAKAHQQRDIIIIGSTSWTEDDDYTILIEALQRLDHRIRHVCKYINPTAEHHGGSVGIPSWRNTPVITPMENNTRRFPSSVPENPYDHGERQNQVSDRSSVADANLEDVSCSSHLFSRIWVLITGKGPARARFEDAVRAAHLSKHITVSTRYFQSYKHYSIALGAADVGLCLHFSSSGVDLPMKGVDMLGCGIPVVALAYPAIGELMGQVVVPAEASLAEQRTLTSVSKNRRNSDTFKGSVDGGGLVECERGWIFSSAADLEVLLSFFVGMDEFNEDMSLELKTAMTAVMSNRTLAAKTAKLTPLLEMQRRARAAAAQRPIWEDNWNQTLGNVISQFA